MIVGFLLNLFFLWSLKQIIAIENWKRNNHDNLEEARAERPPKKSKSLAMVVLQIMILDIIFSIDSVITAIGMAQEFTIMALAVIIAEGVTGCECMLYCYFKH